MPDVGTNVQINIFSDLGNIFSEIELARTQSRASAEELADRIDILEPSSAVPELETESVPDKELFTNVLNNYQQRELTFSDILRSGLFRMPEIAQPSSEIYAESSLFEPQIPELPGIEFPVLDKIFDKIIDPINFALEIPEISTSVPIQYEIGHIEQKMDFALPETQFPAQEYNLPEIGFENIDISVPDIENADITPLELPDRPEIAPIDYNLPQIELNGVNFDIIEPGAVNVADIVIPERQDFSSPVFDLPETGFNPLEWQNISTNSYNMPELDLPEVNVAALSFPDIDSAPIQIDQDIIIPQTSQAVVFNLPEIGYAESIPDISYDALFAQFEQQQLPNIEAPTRLDLDLPYGEVESSVPALNIETQSQQFDPALPNYNVDALEFTLPELSIDQMVPDIQASPTPQPLLLFTPEIPIFSQLELDTPILEYAESEFELPANDIQPLEQNIPYAQEYPAFNPDLDTDRGEYQRPDAFGEGLSIDTGAIAYDNNPSLNSGGLAVW
jgi:hypothetical protein